MTRFGKYDLLAPIAEGGMAEIFLARLLGTAGFEKLVVVKRLREALTINPDYVEMFLDEARINARLSHGNVVQVLELGQVEGRYFMAMEYVAGLTVAKLGKKATQRLGAVPQEVACGVVSQACEGLHHAHMRTMPDGTPLGIIHRDVSPQNLILSFEGNVKVVDFGIAKATGRIAHTRTGLIKGKSAYMSPEQCLTEPLDSRSDVFSLGIVLWELCTPRRLFKRPSQQQTFDAITKEPIPLPASLNTHINPAVEAVIMRALARNRDERFASAADLQDGLEKAMAKSGLTGTPSALARFLDEHFADEREEQQRLLVLARKGEVGQTDPSVLAFPGEDSVDQPITDEEEALPPSDADAGATVVDPDPTKGMSPPEHFDSETQAATMVRTRKRLDDTQKNLQTGATNDTGPSKKLTNMPQAYWVVAGLMLITIILLVLWAIL